MSAQPDAAGRRWRFSVDQYERMAGTVFGEDDRVELLDGEIVSMAPVGPTHASVVDRLTHVFSRTVGDRAIVRVQNPVRLPPSSEPQPDLALLHPRDDFYAARHPGPADVLLVIEVCDSTLAFDRGVKLPIYARAGLAQVWLVDVAHRRIAVHREPRDRTYTVTDVRRPGELVSTGPPLDLDLYVSTLLGA